MQTAHLRLSYYIKSSFSFILPSDSISSSLDLDLCTGGWVVVRTFAVTAGRPVGLEEDGEEGEVVANSSSSKPGLLTAEVH